MQLYACHAAKSIALNAPKDVHCGERDRGSCGAKRRSVLRSARANKLWCRVGSKHNSAAFRIEMIRAEVIAKAPIKNMY